MKLKDVYTKSLKDLLDNIQSIGREDLSLINIEIEGGNLPDTLPEVKLTYRINTKKGETIWL